MLALHVKLYSLEYIQCICNLFRLMIVTVDNRNQAHVIVILSPQMDQHFNLSHTTNLNTETSANGFLSTSFPSIHFVRGPLRAGP